MKHSRQYDHQLLDPKTEAMDDWYVSERRKSSAQNKKPDKKKSEQDTFVPAFSPDDVQAAAYRIVQKDENMVKTYLFLQRIDRGEPLADRKEELMEFFKPEGEYRPIIIYTKMDAPGATPDSQGGPKARKELLLGQFMVGTVENFPDAVATYLHEMSHYIDIWYASLAPLVHRRKRNRRDERRRGIEDEPQKNKSGIANPAPLSGLPLEEQQSALGEHINVTNGEIVDVMKEPESPSDTMRERLVKRNYRKKVAEVGHELEGDELAKFRQEQIDLLNKGEDVMVDGVVIDNAYDSYKDWTVKDKETKEQKFGKIEMGYVFEKQLYASHHDGKTEGWAESYKQWFRDTYKSELLLPQRKSLGNDQQSDSQESEADAIAQEIINGGANPVTVRNYGAPVRSQKEGAEISPEFQSLLVADMSGGKAIDDETRMKMESRFGADFKRVRIHADEKAATLSQMIGAQAFTVGEHVFFNDGLYTPGSQQGDKLIAHELVHVVQQRKAGRQQIQRKKAELVSGIQLINVDLREVVLGTILGSYYNDLSKSPLINVKAENTWELNFLKSKEEKDDANKCVTNFRTDAYFTPFRQKATDITVNVLACETPSYVDPKNPGLQFQVSGSFVPLSVTLEGKDAGFKVLNFGAEAKVTIDNGNIAQFPELGGFLKDVPYPLPVTAGGANFYDQILYGNVSLVVAFKIQVGIDLKGLLEYIRNVAAKKQKTGEHQKATEKEQQHRNKAEEHKNNKNAARTKQGQLKGEIDAKKNEIKRIGSDKSLTPDQKRVKIEQLNKEIVERETQVKQLEDTWKQEKQAMDDAHKKANAENKISRQAGREARQLERKTEAAKKSLKDRIKNTKKSVKESIAKRTQQAERFLKKQALKSARYVLKKLTPVLGRKVAMFIAKMVARVVLRFIPIIGQLLMIWDAIELAWEIGKLLWEHREQIVKAILKAGLKALDYLLHPDHLWNDISDAISDWWEQFKQVKWGIQKTLTGDPGGNTDTGPGGGTGNTPGTGSGNGTDPNATAGDGQTPGAQGTGVPGTEPEGNSQDENQTVQGTGTDPNGTTTDPTNMPGNVDGDTTTGNANDVSTSTGTDPNAPAPTGATTSTGGTDPGATVPTGTDTTGVNDQTTTEGTVNDPNVTTQTGAGTTTTTTAGSGNTNPVPGADPDVTQTQTPGTVSNTTGKTGQGTGMPGTETTSGPQMEGTQKGKNVSTVPAQSEIAETGFILPYQAPPADATKLDLRRHGAKYYTTTDFVKDSDYIFALVIHYDKNGESRVATSAGPEFFKFVGPSAKVEGAYEFTVKNGFIVQTDVSKIFYKAGFHVHVMLE